MTDTTLQHRAANIELLVAIVKQQDARVRQLVGSGFDFVSFQRFITESQLAGYVYLLLAASSAKELFPSALLDSFEAYYLRQQAQNRQLLVEVKQLRKSFSAAGRQFILLKGLYLAKRFYGAFDRRAFWDIDILVKKEDLPFAENILTRSSYERKSHVFIHAELSRYFTHAFDFRKKGAALDLHWALSTHPAHRIDYANLWAKKQRFSIEDDVFFVLPDEYEVVFNVLAVLRDLERAALRVRSLVDLYMILKAVSGRLNWTEFFAHRREERISKISAAILSLFLTTFHCEDEFPDLARALETEEAKLRKDPMTLAELLTPSRFGIANKLWASRVYEPRIGYFIWWMISLPFRLSVYKPGKFSRFKTNLLRNLRPVRHA
jgi:hypothetical protein